MPELMDKIDRHRAAALHVLGHLTEHYAVKPFIREQAIEWGDMIVTDDYASLSTGEHTLVRFARSLYNGGNCDLLHTATFVDDDAWRRCIQALLMVRGLEEPMHVNPGTWMGGQPE